MAVGVQVHAQMGMARVLKPPANFEQAYEGVSASSVPIAIPGTLDPIAGKQGYDSQLMAGISVPMGSRLLLWFPQSIAGEADPTVYPYTYRILWRLRAQGDGTLLANQGAQGNQRGLQGHLNQNYAGIPNDDGADPSDLTQLRYVMPCALHEILFEQTEPGTTFSDVINNLRGEDLSIRGSSYAPSEAPLLVSNPALKGVAGQGIYPAPGASTAQFGGPTFLPYWCDAVGDEFIILVTRNQGGGGLNWSFGGDDFAFSRVYGTANGRRAAVPGLGIYAMTGTGAT